MTLKLTPVLAWFRQTSTIAGVMIFAGIAADLVTHNIIYAAAATAAVGVIMPGHLEMKGEIAQLSADVAGAVASKGAPSSLVAITSDLVQLASSFPANTPVVAVAPISSTFQVLHPSTVMPVPPPVAAPVLTPAA
jgi:hypothetical protein